MAVRTTYFFGSYSSVKKPFIIQINSGADGTFTIPTTGGGYNYEVSTSDGQNFTGVTGNLTITFPSANTDYFIEISGEFPAVVFGSLSFAMRPNLLEVIQCGDILVERLLNAFTNCNNLKWEATDFFKVVALNSATGLLQNTLSISDNANVSLWDMSNFTGLYGVLLGVSYNNEVDWTSPITGTINCNSFNASFYNSKIKTIKIRCDASPIFNTTSFTSTHIENLICLHADNSIWINNTPNLTGSAIDNLFTSLGTANTGANITLTTAQNTSGIDTTIATSKGWTIIVV